MCEWFLAPPTMFLCAKELVLLLEEVDLFAHMFEHSSFPVSVVFGVDFCAFLLLGMVMRLGVGIMFVGEVEEVFEEVVLGDV